MNVTTEHQVNLVVKQHILDSFLHRHPLRLDRVGGVAVDVGLVERHHNPRGYITVYPAQITLQPCFLSTSILQTWLFMSVHHLWAVASNHHKVHKSGIKGIIQFLSSIHSGVLVPSLVCLEVMLCVEPLVVTHSGLEGDLGSHGLAHVAETVPQWLVTCDVQRGGDEAIIIIKFIVTMS